MNINKNSTIFICDDDKALNALIKTHLTKKGFKNISSYYSGEDTVKNAEKLPDVVIQDFDLPGMNGKETMMKFKEKSPLTEFVFLSGQESIKVAVEIMQNGAFDYVMKDGYAPENAYHKVLKVLKIKKLEKDRKAFKIGLFSFVGLFLLSWILYYVFFF